MSAFNPLSPAPDAPPPTVLLVEDEPKVLDRVRAMLERECRCQVLAAGDPEQALRLFEATNVHVDVLLTDVSLPLMNGVALSARLRAAQPGLKVLFMSGFFEDALEKYYGVNLAEEEFLHKPFSAADLSERLSEILNLQPF